MIRKFLAKVSSFFSSQSASERIFDDFLEQAKKEAKDAEAMEEEATLKKLYADNRNITPALPAVQLNMDTGKITYPDGMSDEDKAKIEADLLQTIQAFAGPDAFKSLEEFIKAQSAPLLIPFTTVNTLPDGYDKIAEEMMNCKEDNEHWNDTDYLEALMSYYNEGYVFDGIESLYNKVSQRGELLEEEKKMLRDWYVLVSQDQVYEA